MTALVWDQVGERRYEAGLDRGVLIDPFSDTIVPWNGLVSVVETTSREVKPYYLDGRKYLEQVTLSEYEAKLSAFTYPDQLDFLTGASAFEPGVFIHDQLSYPFNIAYRTKVGNDLDPDAAYKLHIVYNVKAMPSDSPDQTLTEQVALSPMEWTLTSIVPTTEMGIWGYHPSSHISFDTRRAFPEVIQSIEEMLYGTAEMTPYLPTLDNLLMMVEDIVDAVNAGTWGT